MGSLKIGTFWGIPVFLHWSFALIFLLAGYQGFTSGSGDPLLTTAWLSGLFLAVFVCVLLHEYGHALAARRYGVHTRDIILTPIGGIARLEAMPKTPWQEFVVAIAGPAVNVLIALALFLPVMQMLDTDPVTLFREIGYGLKTAFFEVEEAAETAPEETADIGETWPYFLFALLFINCSLVVFNMIPAFPMDGGRVLRALLAMRMNRVQATRIAALFGQIFAVGFVFLGLWKGSFMMALIGVFVFTTARNEFGMVKLEDLLGRFTARDLMRTNFTELTLNDWMQTPIGLVTQGAERNFLVVDMEDNLIGTLGEAAVVRAMKMGRTSATVEQFYSTEYFVVEIDDPLRKVYQLIKGNGYPILAVSDGENGTGIIDNYMLDNFLELQTKLKG